MAGGVGLCIAGFLLARCTFASVIRPPDDLLQQQFINLYLPIIYLFCRRPTKSSARPIGFILPIVELFDFDQLCPRCHGFLGAMDVKAMKKFVLTGFVALLLASPAMAADLRVRQPVYKAPPPPPPVYFSWTGCYVGAHVGGLWARKDWAVREPGDIFFGQSDGSHDADGWLGGLQAGCDYQFAGGFVIGIAGDYAWADADGSNTSLLFPGFTNHTKVKSLASVTGRIGYAWDRFLGYVKGGGAWERDEHDFTDGVFSASVSATRSGWTIGVGGEYAFTNFLTGFIEYNYYDFGSRDLTFAGTGGPFIYGIDETKSVLKAGLNFRFGGWSGPPVAARY
jgi:outer membrane immunogenic protein